MKASILIAAVLATAFAVACAQSVDPDPTSVRTAIDTLEPQVKAQSADIRQVRNSILSKATIGDGAQVQSGVQRVNAALTNGASNATVSRLQKDAIELMGEVNDAHAATASVTLVMKDAQDSSRFMEAQSIRLIDEAATAKGQIDEARARLDGIVDQGDKRADDFPVKADVFDDIEASLSALEDEIDEMLDGVAEFPDTAASTLASMYENKPGFKGSNTKPVYRYSFFDLYGPNSGWSLGNNDDLFGDVDPDNWSRNSRAYEISTNFETIRAMMTETGYIGPQGTIAADDKFYYGSSDMGRMLALVFRIRNKSSSTISHRFYYYYSSYYSWSDRSSASLNDNSNWYVNNNCGSCSTSYSYSFPGNKVSTLIWMISASPRTSSRRVVNLQFYSNSLRLPSQLEWVDDLDTAQAWLEDI